MRIRTLFVTRFFGRNANREVYVEERKKIVRRSRRQNDIYAPTCCIRNVTYGVHGIQIEQLRGADNICDNFLSTRLAIIDRENAVPLPAPPSPKKKIASAKQKFIYLSDRITRFPLERKKTKTKTNIRQTILATATGRLVFKNGTLRKALVKLFSFLTNTIRYVINDKRKPYIIIGISGKLLFFLFFGSGSVWKNLKKKHYFIFFNFLSRVRHHR